MANEDYGWNNQEPQNKNLEQLAITIKQMAEKIKELEAQLEE